MTPMERHDERDFDAGGSTGVSADATSTSATTSSPPDGEGVQGQSPECESVARADVAHLDSFALSQRQRLDDSVGNFEVALDLEAVAVAQ